MFGTVYFVAICVLSDTLRRRYVNLPEECREREGGSPELTAAALRDSAATPAATDACTNAANNNTTSYGADGADRADRADRAHSDSSLSARAMVRSESEFSLGLNRCLSIDDKLVELGLCDTGHWALTVGRFALFSSLGVYVARRYLQGEGSRE